MGKNRLRERERGDLIKSLVESFPRRVKAVIDRKTWYT
jgi:hypothetical protein